jgi:serine/threonine protein kinase
MSVLAEGSQLSCPKCGASLQRSGDLAGQCFVCLLGLALEETAVQTADLKRFDHYEIATNADGSPVVLGRGAMGTTFKAVDTILKNDVALKVIDASLAAHPEARERFLREARAAAGLRHPNVASVFYYGVRDTDGHCFYAMELVEGETLESRLRRSGPLDIGSVLEVASQVALALVAAEARGLVHRDLKPANLMLLKGPQPTVKVIDFGLSKAAAASANDPNLTYGGFVGTAAFASPEQCTGATVDSRSDLYSLGVTLWELLTGQVPFRGSPSEVMYQHQHAALPLDLLKEVPKQVVVLLEVLLAKDKACRFQTPTEFLKVIPMVREAVRTGRRIRKTVRVFVSSTGDVQKERNLAESVMRSVAADFNLAVIESYSNSQRLEEANGELEEELEDHEKLILCPYFWPYQGLEADVREPIPDITQFDMIICILWSRLGVLADPAFRMPNGDPAGPGGIPSSHIYHNCSKPTPPLEPKEERELFGRQWDAVQQFFAQSEKNSQGNFAGRLTNYHNLEEFEELFREHFRNILASRIGREVGQKILSPKVPRWKSSPFRGLNIFGFEHAPIFHGRTKAIGEVLEALDEQFRAQRPFLLIVGASGSGKSSLVQAGVLPLLTQPETIEGIGLWRWAVTRPGAGGSGGDCFDALAGALLEPHALPTLQDPESTDAIHNLASELRGHSDTVALRIRDALDYAAREWKIRHFRDLEKKECQLRDSQRLDEANSAQEQKQRLLQPKARLALVVDQLEELFTSGFSTDVRQKYISVVSGLVRSGRVTILATLRSDFYPSYQEFPDLIELTKPAGKFDLRPPTRHEIGNLIRLPAEAAGLRFEQQETGIIALREAGRTW